VVILLLFRPKARLENTGAFYESVAKIARFLSKIITASGGRI